MNYNRLIESPQTHDRYAPLSIPRLVSSSTMASNTSNNGTVPQEKSKLSFFRITPRSSTDSERSTDALIQKPAKKQQPKPVSTKAVFDSKRSFLYEAAVWV
jgi:hypothetical protein